MTLDATLKSNLNAAFAGHVPERLGVAVSGGGDSVALLHLLRYWADGQGVALSAATINHGLRDGALEEARAVADLCAGLDVPHMVLTWTGWDEKGNLQDAARQARYGLLAQWAHDADLAAVALGHTRDDQAETFLMRLARGSGVDGLSSMRHDWQADGTRWLRPLLDIARQDLRSYLSDHQFGWVDDPSNDDLRFDRVKARKALVALAPLGVTAERLADTSRWMTSASKALGRYAVDAARDVVSIQSGDVLFAPQGLAKLPDETQMRLFAHALMWVSSAEYRPRQDALHEVMAHAACGKTRTLHGCLITGIQGTIRISREYNAVRDTTCQSAQVWDNRWRVRGPGDDGLRIRALGEAVKDCLDWRDSGLPRTTLMAMPAVWHGDVLIAAPLAGLHNGWSAEIVHPTDHFFTSALSH